MASAGEPGTSVPRIVRNVSSCLSCRRLGKRCHAGTPGCVTCKKDNIECLQPISAISGQYALDPPPLPGARAKRRKAGPESETKSETETRPESGAGSRSGNDIEMVTRQGPEICPEACTPIELFMMPRAAALLRSGIDFGYGVASGSTTESESESESQPESPDEAMLEHDRVLELERPVFAQMNAESESEPEPESEPVPRTGVFFELLKRKLVRTQRTQLQQTPGYVQGPVHGPDDPAVDQDHDYACYYDYHYDIDSDDTAIDHTDRNRKRSHTPYTLDSASRTSTVYQVKNTWAGKGAPPLASRLHDYLDYMRECHLSHAPSTALPISLLPANEYAASEMLWYYSLRPVNCSTTPLPDINPTNPKLFDLAYSNPLVLQLIIAQRANHREVSSAILPTGESADRFYATAISEFGPKIDSYLAGNEQDMLPLTLGSLVLSLTERARLDKRGQAHNHPTAAKDILRMLVTLPHEEICKNLPDILIEYYMHTAAFACIAADVTTAKSIPFVSETLLDAADDLIIGNYHGKLCGSWLPILGVIQGIFHLGISMRPYVDGPSDAPSASPSTGYTPNHFVTFGKIQEKLFSFAPARDPSIANIEAATLFRNAALLYLWSLLEWPHAAKPQGSYAGYMKGAYLDALRQLDRISEISSVNRALCWPLLIIGCFATTARVRGLVASRLSNISGRFKVGNALETLLVLRHVWKLPLEKRNPWMVHKSIRETKCWGCVCKACIPQLF